MPGAMPWKNRWIGNPSLSFLGRLFFKTPIRDFHCGLRAFTRAAYDRMNLKTTGMEFASEMVMKATLADMNIDFILDERARELTGETTRWFDLKRTGKLLERVKLYNPDGAPNIKEMHLLRPLPNTEILNSTGNMKQNPGY